jgi:DNA-binding winged helix-turn-helix (wHTH) protein
VEFRILGPVEVVSDGRVVALGPSKQRALLALLLLHVNEVVSSDRLIDDLWGERAPQTATTSLHTYVSQLRKLLEAGNGTEPRTLITRAPGYLLALDPDQVDLTRFDNHQWEPLQSDVRRQLPGRYRHRRNDCRHVRGQRRRTSNVQRQLHERPVHRHVHDTRQLHRQGVSTQPHLQ